MKHFKNSSSNLIFLLDKNNAFNLYLLIKTLRNDMESKYTQYKRITNRLLESKEDEIEELKLDIFRRETQIKVLEKKEKELLEAHKFLVDDIYRKKGLINRMERDGYTHGK